MKDITLRAYRETDAAVICTWIRNEEELYRWSADRLGRFPLAADDLNRFYAPRLREGRFYPLTAEDAQGQIIGHFFIRFPYPEAPQTARFGFVIVSPECRGQGMGSAMLRQGIAYAEKELCADRIDLGVFVDNAPAKRCYEALGFREYGRRHCVFPVGAWDCADMELLLKKQE